MTTLQESPDLLFPGTALFSDDYAYRYSLTRLWGDGQVVVWVMLNPSTADAFELDPTIRRCVDFTRRWGHDGLRVVNRFGLRSTNPKRLKAHADPVGRDNSVAIIDAIRDVNTAFVVAAWGAHNAVEAQWAPALIDLCKGLDKPLHCLGRTARGAPRHPLYVRGDKQLEEFS